jgi:hypothetical protein
MPEVPTAPTVGTVVYLENPDPNPDPILMPSIMRACVRALFFFFFVLWGQHFFCKKLGWNTFCRSRQKGYFCSYKKTLFEISKTILLVIGQSSDTTGAQTPHRQPVHKNNRARGLAKKKQRNDRFRQKDAA